MPTSTGLSQKVSREAAAVVVQGTVHALDKFHLRITTPRVQTMILWTARSNARTYRQAGADYTNGRLQ